MSRIQLACCCLIASAFALTGLLITSWPMSVTPQAQAGVVLNKETLTLLTAQTRRDEEALFILDNLNEKLLIYRLNLAKRQLELAGAADLPKLFSEGGTEKQRDRRGR